MAEWGSVLDRLERISGRRATALSLAAWATAEAIVFPVVPDVGLCLVVLAAPKRAARLFGFVVVGALAGTIVLAAFATRAPDAARTMLLAVPGIDSSDLADASASLVRNGVAGFAQVGPGTPLKVDTVEWLARGGDTAGLLVGAFVNRITRIGPPLIGAALVGRFAGGWLRRHERIVLAVYAALWLLLYAYLWVVV
jgi:hypothetical protein